MDLVEQRFGKPRRTLQYGHSGGGHLALAMAETRPDRINGAIVGCAHTPVWLMNSELDAWFTLKTLIAPHLAIVDLPADPTSFGCGLEAGAAGCPADPDQTCTHRVGHRPGTIGGMGGPRGAEARSEGHRHSAGMYESLAIGAAQSAGQSRRMFEQGGRGQLSRTARPAPTPTTIPSTVAAKPHRLVPAANRCRRCPSARASASNWCQSSGGCPLSNILRNTR